MVKICEPAIYELLNGLAGGNVFSMRAPDNSAGPFIVYQRSAAIRWRHINGPSGITQAFIQIDAYAATYLEAKALGAEIEDILDGYIGNVSHGSNSPQDFVAIGGISLQNDNDFIDETDEPLLYRNSASYLVTYEQ